MCVSIWEGVDEIKRSIHGGPNPKYGRKQLGYYRELKVF